MDLKVRATSEYKNISLGETFESLKASADGLSDSEAKNRLEKFGYNAIVEKKNNPPPKFLL